MKKFLLILGIAFVSNLAVAQDLIVLLNGDSLNCRINKINKKSIYFSTVYNNEVHHTSMTKARLFEYRYGFYPKSEIPEDKARTSKGLAKLRFGIGAGYSYRIAKISNEVPSCYKSYVKKLKNGHHFDVNLTYFFGKSVGLGLQYAVFNTKNSEDDYVLSDGEGNSISGKLSDNVSISFVGPVIMFKRQGKKLSNAFFTSIALGYMEYTDQAKMVFPYKLSGNTIGIGLGMGFDIGLTDNSAIGFKLSYFSGKINTFDFESEYDKSKITMESDNGESMSRLDFSIGFRFII
jgi:hypothetical protein